MKNISDEDKDGERHHWGGASSDKLLEVSQNTISTDVCKDALIPGKLSIF